MTKRALCLFVAVIGLCVLTPSFLGCVSDKCKDPANATDPACVAENVLADCTGSDVASVLSSAEPIIAKHIQDGVNPDGSINYNAIEADLVQDVIKFGECAVTDAWTKFFTPAAKLELASGATPTKRPTPDAAKAAYAKFRAAHMSKHHLKTTNAGVL